MKSGDVQPGLHASLIVKASRKKRGNIHLDSFHYLPIEYFTGVEKAECHGALTGHDSDRMRWPADA
jgi:hypothetical protein